jgi:hypothetical protein
MLKKVEVEVLKNGDVKILLNLISLKYLRSAGIKPILSNICYPVWGTKPYGKESQQHAKLQKRF